MAGLSGVFSVTRASATMASMTGDSPSRLPPPASPKTLPKKQTKTGGRRIRDRNGNLRRKRSVVQIERAIGAGSYRDSENGEMEEMSTVFDELLMGQANKFEGSVEKKLREVGEAFVDQTETRFRSSGKPLLMIAFKWILPIWTLSLLLACGLIKLPFSLPFLDDFIM